MARVDFQKIALMIQKEGDRDGSRGNHYLDTGFSSSVNQTRTAESSGISRPSLLKHHDHPELLSAMLALSLLAPLVAHSDISELVFSDPNRMEEFAGRLAPGITIEAFRAALTTLEKILYVHCDRHNCYSPK